MGVLKEVFGTTSDGVTVYRFTLTNAQGTKLVVSDYGALLTELHVADKNGAFKDVVLGADTVAPYEENGCCFGATVGRSANRIGGATFVLNGVKYDLPVNDNDNNLHSGPDMYYKRVWNTKAFGEDENGDQYITFSLHSPHMDQGYPGNLDMDVTYTLTAANEVKIRYVGKADQDTLMNMTNHSYFNLAGHDSGVCTGQKVFIDADFYTKATKDSIPTGELIAVKGTPMDFTTERAMSIDIDADYQPLVWAGGYDHNYALNGYANAKGGMFLAGSLFDENSGRFMEIFTDLPGMQLYSGNYIKGGFEGKGGFDYQKRAGVCFETQFFPNAINCPEFVSPVVKAGETYDTTTIYKFSVKA